MEVRCKNCGTILTEKQNFCPSCGTITTKKDRRRKIFIGIGIAIVLVIRNFKLCEI